MISHRKTRKRRAARLSVPVLIALAGSAGALAGQSIRLIPSAGLYVPQSDLGQFGSGSGTVEVAKMESTLGFGLAVELMPQRGVSLRLNAVYGTQSSIPVSGVGCSDCEARSTVSAVTAAAVIRPIPDLVLFRPYFLAGGGLKRYDFDEDDLRSEGLDSFFADQSKFTAQLGVGLEFNLGLARLLVEVSDFVSGFDVGSASSRFDGDRQHDFFMTLGIGLGG